MEILCINEYGDEELSLGDMEDYELLNRDLNQVLLDTLYCAYYAVPLKERPEALYEVIANAGMGEITLEAVMQHGDEELPDFPDFLILWITYLGNKAERKADSLVSEAVGLLGDVSAAAVYAEKFADIHPGIYLNILENQKYADADTMVSTGMEALKMIPKKYIMRSNVALKTAEYVVKADGQFADVLTEGLNCSAALGWSGTFMKQGIALYLLYLYEGQWTNKGIAEMAVIVRNAMSFSAGKYQRGLHKLQITDEKELFFDLFSKWKSIVPMEPDIRTRAIKKITGLLEKRTEGIMTANRRNYYGECAAYIAALGEVQESLGEKDAKQRLMTSYKEKYSRRSAFRAEMKSYGWKDAKKK